jgi:hypothetical protein
VVLNAPSPAMAQKLFCEKPPLGKSLRVLTVISQTTRALTACAPVTRLGSTLQSQNQKFGGWGKALRSFTPAHAANVFRH